MTKSVIRKLERHFGAIGTKMIVATEMADIEDYV